MKDMLKLGSLKPMKIKAHKTSKEVSGHMPVSSGSFGRQMGSKNHFTGKNKGVVLG